MALFRQQRTAILEVEGEKAAMNRLLVEAGEADDGPAETVPAKPVEDTGDDDYSDVPVHLPNELIFTGQGRL